MGKNERLILDDFLVLKRVDLDVKRINIIIGPQASGKSILAKLIYFFREIINEKLLQSVANGEDKEALLQQIELLFNQYFPPYTWKNRAFSIEYICYDLRIKINKDSRKKRISIECNNRFLWLYDILRSKYEKYESNREFYFYHNLISDDKEVGKYFNIAIFIPAGRSFFVNIQKNIFSLLSKNIDIDPLLKSFGSYYELIKKVYNDFMWERREFLDINLYKRLINLIEKILDGKYVFEDRQDWIQKDSKKLNIAHTSSGQQESLPMLLTLLVSPILFYNRNIIYFIEEPESHLFPTSQRDIVCIIAMIYNLRNSSVFLTTHSPYILTAVNNLILARDVLNDKNKKQVYKLVDRDTLINFEDVAAYTIENACLKTIIDNKIGLIGTNIIDSVSDDFSKTFDKLLELSKDYDRKM